MKEFYVNAWHNNENYNANIVNNIINIANEKGEYYYNIIGCWEKAYVSYVFKILVE